MEVAQFQIDAWKKQYGEVYKITVEDKCCFLKTPSRQALGYASVAGRENPLKFNEVILNDAWLDGDKEIKEVDSYFFAACQKIDQLIEVKNSELEKL